MRPLAVASTWRRLYSRSWRQPQFICNRCLSTSSKPALFRMLEDGSEQPIKEEDLYSYQRHRWLRNDREQRDMRYVEFNLDALISKALRKGKEKPEGKECVRVTKLLEGDNNKTLLLTMNDGDEVIARLPNPIAGPSYFTVASEVATRIFISLAFDSIPMPRIWDWDFRHKNEVGAEWILEDKAVGLPLDQFWFKMNRKEQHYIVKQIVKIEKKLGAIKFPHHGSLYRRRWLAGDGIPSSSLESLHSLNNISMATAEGGHSMNYMFLNHAMGPSVDRRLYHRRGLLKEHHGPFLSLPHYARCLGRNERRYVKNMGWDRPNYFQSIKSTEDPQDIAKLTNQFLAISPYIGTHAADDLSTISHPDLTLDNIFINPDTKEITCLTGWQGTVVSPPILKPPYPSFLDTKLESVSKNVKEIPPRDLYRELISEAEPLRFYRIYENPKEHRIITAPLSAIRGAYEAQTTFDLRESLINFINYYEIEGDKPLPQEVRPTSEELKAHEHERLARTELQMTFHMVQDADRLKNTDYPDIPLDGRVRTEDFENAQRRAREYRKEYIELAGTNKNRIALHKKLWPLNDLGDRSDDDPEVRDVPKVRDAPMVRRISTSKGKNLLETYRGKFAKENNTSNDDLKFRDVPEVPEVPRVGDAPMVRRIPTSKGKNLLESYRGKFAKENNSSDDDPKDRDVPEVRDAPTVRRVSTSKGKFLLENRRENLSKEID